MGKGFDLGGLFRQAQELQEKLASAQQELASADAGRDLGHLEHRLAAAEREPGHRVLARHGGG